MSEWKNVIGYRTAHLFTEEGVSLCQWHDARNIDEENTVLAGRCPTCRKKQRVLSGIKSAVATDNEYMNEQYARLGSGTRFPTEYAIRATEQ